MPNPLCSLIFAAFLLASPLYATSCPDLLENPTETKKYGPLRRKALRSWDRLLTWTLSPKNQEYVLVTPTETKVFQVASKEILDFDEHYGHFSVDDPIVGLVTRSESDREASFCLMRAIHAAGMNKAQSDFSTAEALAKVVAYRLLEQGTRVPIWINHNLQFYRVEEVLDLWHGMPAFGLVPEKGKAPPILLFRGTDLSFPSAKGWASVLSDLDLSGPGYTTFLRAQHKIEVWLRKMKSTHRPARLIGFSLGGAFVLYTMIHHYDLVNTDDRFPSLAFNCPGVSKGLLQKWNDIPSDLQPPHFTYLNRGDFVSQIGCFLSNVWLLTLPEPMGVIESHLTLISAQPKYRMTLVDLDAENEKRK